MQAHSPKAGGLYLSDGACDGDAQREVYSIH